MFISQFAVIDMVSLLSCFLIGQFAVHCQCAVMFFGQCVVRFIGQFAIGSLVSVLSDSLVSLMPDL